jgi:hypothetical protein
VQKLEKDFEVLDLQHISRANIAIVDELSTKASTWAPMPDGVFEWKLQRHTARPIELGEGGDTSTLNLAVPAALVPWSPPRIVGVIGDSVHPDTQDLEAQVSPDA